MEHIVILLIIIAMLLICPALLAESSRKPIVHIFHKHKTPSLKALEKIDALLDNYRDLYDIRYHDIEDEANLELIHSLGLPSTHFPVAVVIDGKFTVQMGDRIASFVHFPDFMHGIGRHEGNWSISDLEAALQDKSLLLEENILPELEEGETEGECE